MKLSVAEASGQKRRGAFSQVSAVDNGVVTQNISKQREKRSVQQKIKVETADSWRHKHQRTFEKKKHPPKLNVETADT